MKINLKTKSISRRHIALFVWMLTLLHNELAGGATKTPIADALDWCSIWFGQSGMTAGTQTCQGEFLDNRYQFRCDPLGVVVSAQFDDASKCFVSAMRPSISPNDGTRLQATQRSKGPARPDCPELPITSRNFKVQVTPHARPIDPVLSDQARAAALAYVKAGGDRSCLLRIPGVRSGDPFVHVYEDCHGVLDAVFEFKIEQDRVEDFPQWTYDRPHKNIPNGAESRRSKADLWFAVSTPEDRKK